MGSASTATARRRSTRSPRKEKRRRVVPSLGSPIPVTATRRRTPAPRSAAIEAPAIVGPKASLTSLARAAELNIAAAKAGDHVQLPLLWTAAAAGPSVAEYQANIDDPDYLPSQRLLAKRGNTVVGHAQLDAAPLFMGDSALADPWLKVARIRHLVVLPEFRGAGVEGRILQAAEERVRAEGSPLVIARDVAPENFLARGWAPFSALSASMAKARDLLAALVSSRGAATGGVNGVVPPSYQVRLWRHVELDGLVRLHSIAAPRPAGAIQRDRAAWRRLIQRHAYDRIYVALEGRDCRVDSLQASDHLAGYAVVSRQRIVELVADPRHPDAQRQLLARACGDAVELGWHEVRLDAAPADPLHPLFLEAGGKGIFGPRDGAIACLAKIVDFPAMISFLGTALAARLHAARVPAPCRLGVEIGGISHSLEVTRSGAAMTTGRAPRTWFSTSEATFTRLVLGQLAIDAAIERQELCVSGPLVRRLLAVLFPRQAWWLPPWEDLEA